ncbi:MAG: asparagine synthase (glutamine-hydrolyzing) [Oscillospiraceae bacterium]|jgi:asparagine synthase (glutamine-hydrolysing)|nr:asparagine synthase (glutamine-hydrolyzing) [Oscillospiraceae bacterium]
MCGIAGVIGWEEPLEKKTAVFEAMQAALRRRGPDQKGMYIDSPAALIHTRLSVVDPENGAQPMFFSRMDEDYALIYNGELYNTKELRLELNNLGHRFRGHSDTEVLLHAYAEWSENCVERLNGIFAFAVWEKHRQRLFVARDRIGVKPFFYAIRDGVLLFASEIKALLAHPLVEPEIDMDSIADILLIGPGRTPGRGVFRGVEELPPAACGFFSRGGLRLRQYWRLEDREHTDTFEQTVEKVRALVMDAIERQLVSDVPVGAFLSGGLDSSIISSVSSRCLRGRGKELCTFSVDYKDNERYFQKSRFQPDSDHVFIQRMNQYLGVKHHRVLLDTDELAGALYAAVDARDLPGMADVDSSLLLFCGEVKKHITVALSGECADEIFGGYPWYRDQEIRERDGFPWAQSTAYRAAFLKPEFAAETDVFRYVDTRYRKTVEETSVLPGTDGNERRMREMMGLNLKWFMQTLLDRKDRMSMYNGLEVRVPFCDYRIAEYLYTVPWEMKDYQNREKGLLRMAVRDLLPGEVLWRKKSPYPKTHNPAYRKAVSEKLRDIIADPAAPVLRIARKEVLEALLKNENPVMWYGQLMAAPQTVAYFLQLNYWLEKYRVRIV